MTELLSPPAPEKFADNFVDFRHHQTSRISKLEAEVAKQRRINEAILAYVEADISATWMSSARELAAAIHAALKE